MAAVRIIIAVVLAIFLIAGLRRGLIRQVLEVIGIIAAFITAFYFAHALATWIAGRVDLNYSVTLTVAALLIFAGIITVFHALGLALRKFFNMTILGLFDRIAGGVFGLVKGLLLISLVLVIILTLPFPASVKQPILEDSVTASIYPLLPVIFDLVVTRVPGGDRFESIARIGGSHTLKEKTERLRRSIEDTGGELKDKVEGFKDKVEGPKDRDEERKDRTK